MDVCGVAVFVKQKCFQRISSVCPTDWAVLAQFAVVPFGGILSILSAASDACVGALFVASNTHTEQSTESYFLPSLHVN